MVQPVGEHTPHSQHSRQRVWVRRERSHGGQHPTLLDGGGGVLICALEDGGAVRRLDDDKNVVVEDTAQLPHEIVRFALC
jgi:hypothetical protein